MRRLCLGLVALIGLGPLGGCGPEGNQASRKPENDPAANQAALDKMKQLTGAGGGIEAPKAPGGPGMPSMPGAPAKGAPQ